MKRHDLIQTNNFLSTISSNST